MNVYIVPSGHVLEPFGEAARDCQVLNRSVAEHQRSAIEALAGRVVVTAEPDAIRDEQGHLIVDDALLFTPELLAEFVARSRALAAPTICALKTGLTTQRTVVTTQRVDVQDGYVSYPLRYLPARAKNGIPQPVVIEPDRMWRTLLLPRHMFGDDEYRFPVTERFIVRIDHWTNLMMANLLGLSALGARLRYGSKTPARACAQGSLGQSLAHFAEGQSDRARL